ncbi:MAG TPA: alpha/beta hydrolase-fold protein [Candidatus Acidoferrales bacterium]|nr:alpha/beta hydrolase-fold protein [Candidatus Acidoferrales bacterium]
MKRSLSSLLIMLLFACAAFAQNPQKAESCRSTVTGQLDIFPFTSKVFENTRNLRIWLPPGYSDPANAGRRYPVLYMLDGQNLFDECTGFGHQEWKVDEKLTRMIAEGKIPPLIVVGIDNAGAKRAYEYLPYRDNVQQPAMEEVAGKRFPEFLGSEVLPWIDAHYRTKTGPENTAIGGSSYGGIAALWALLMREDLFSMGIVESPVLLIGNAQLVRDTKPLPYGPAKVFLATGGSESEMPAANVMEVELVKMLAENLRNAMLRHTEVMLVVEEKAKHNESAWGNRFPAAIEFLFGGKEQKSLSLKQ